MRSARELEIHTRRLVRLKLECPSTDASDPAELKRLLQEATHALLDAKVLDAERLRRLMDVRLDPRSPSVEHELDMLAALLGDGVEALHREAARRGAAWRVLARVHAWIGLPAVLAAVREWLKRLGGL